MSKSLKTLLGFALLGFVGVWIGCSSDSSPVSPHPAGKTHLTSQDPADSTAATTYVTFADTSLERTVRAALNDATVNPTPTSVDATVPPLTDTQLKTLTTINASERGITSLTGLDYATNLDTLNLWKNSITDLSPLSSLTNLKWLNLRKNSITSLSPLSSLTNLDTLNLGENSITDLSPLSSLTNLKWLLLRENRISDLRPLAGLTDLEGLELYQNRISNISPLSLDPLAALTNLEFLAIGANSLDGDTGPVASLTGLKWLKINGVGLRDSELKTLAHALTNLEHLSISGNPLTDFEPLTCLTKLTRLELRAMKRLFMKNAEGNIVLKPEQIHLLYLEKRGVSIFTNPPAWFGWP